jgi:hypothetical protein
MVEEEEEEEEENAMKLSVWREARYHVKIMG